MPEIILPDTSCLIFLDKVGEIEVLQNLYSRTVVTKEIAEEHITPLKNWIEVVDAKDMRYQNVLRQTVDKGEASLMVLALEMENCVVSIDDLRARKVALRLGLKITGTLGVLHKARKTGHIDSMRDVIAKLKHVNFRISEKVEQELLRLSGE
jgi:predicted nucleic acid-binding protein